MPLKPLGDNILVQLDAPETKSLIGLHIPDAAQKENKSQGVVLSIGTEVKHVQVGMRVHLHGSVKLVKPAERIALCREEVIVAYEEDEPPPPNGVLPKVPQVEN